MAFPGWPLLGYFALLALAQNVWFWLVYAGSDYLTAHRTLRLRVHFEFEERLPFVPAAILVYNSVYFLLYAAPFILRSKPELRRFAWRLAVATLVCGVLFWLIPAEPDFAYPADLGVCGHIFRLADRINLDYNQLPSLHLALSAVCASAYSRRLPRIQTMLVWGWVVAVAIAAVLTFQHHILDVVTGFILGTAIERWPRKS